MLFVLCWHYISDITSSLCYNVLLENIQDKDFIQQDKNLGVPEEEPQGCQNACAWELSYTQKYFNDLNMLSCVTMVQSLDYTAIEIIMGLVYYKSVWTCH